MQELIDFLMTPQAYAEATATVRLVQTHISWVFIGDEFVYKLKKPVNFGFLDFTTLEKRKFYVEEELRLNSRFSPEIYVESLPVSLVDGAYKLGDASNVVDYILKMRRIDDAKLLKNLLKGGRITAAQLEQVGRHLAGAYGAIASTEYAREFGALETIGFNVRENFEQTRKYVGGPIDALTFSKIESYSLKFMEDNQELFKKRIADGHIKECHGDLHLEHICLDGERVFVFDCIEFNERFRYGDVAADVAFLAMDLDFNGQPALAQAFVQAYVAASGDSDLPKLLNFYKAYRAYVRAKVTSFMLDDSGIDAAARESATKAAARYYDLAASYAE